MRSQISSIALGVALVAGASAANAQTVITREISEQPVETIITQQPVQTVRTVETIRTERPAGAATRKTARRQVVTTRRTVESERVIPAPAVAAPAVAAATYPQPLYDVVAPAPVVTDPAYPQPLYDTVIPAPPPASAAPVVATMPVAAAVAAPVYTAPVNNPIPTYRYVYEPDRILVIDPNTNIASQAIPR